jgi:ASC-1-like (ASCH) protein
MKPKELRREIKVAYRIWRDSQHAAIENVSGDDKNINNTIERTKKLYEKEIKQLGAMSESIDNLQTHIFNKLSEINKMKI